MKKTWLAGLAILIASSASAADPAISLSGKGDQIYTCANSKTGVAWHLKAPDAVLTDAAGHPAGRHFAGPSWQANDGSTVVGELVQASAAPHAHAVPWLILRAKSHDGTGIFSNVAFIVRTATEGGAAPATGCDSAHAGAEIRVPYSATYSFFPG